MPDREEELTQALANAVNALTAELPDGFRPTAQPDRRYLEVETHTSRTTPSTNCS